MKYKKQEKRQKNGRKKSRKKRKRGPKGVPPEMGPKIDFFTLELSREIVTKFKPKTIRF